MSAANDRRTYRMNPERITHHMRQRGWTAEELAKQADVSVGTISNLLHKQKAVFLSTAVQIQTALGVALLDELLWQDDSTSLPRIDSTQEWNVAEVLTPWITASNQLQFHICRLEHQHLKRRARGKRYELRAMSSADQERCRSLFLRHAEVCAAIGSHPHIIRNLTTYPASDGRAWWVIDEWIEGQTLAEVLAAGPISRELSWRWLLQIAEALEALHLVGIIRRELTPQSILLLDGKVVLTEFELAKLLDGSPSVASDDWPVDDYRAPEAESDDINRQADIYSWGRLAVHLLLGQLPERTRELPELQKLRLSKPIMDLLTRCLAISRRSRPTDFAPVREVVRKLVIP